MNILLTGVAGYIGSNAAEFLLANGHTVYGLDIFDDYYPGPILFSGKLLSAEIFPKT